MSVENIMAGSNIDRFSITTNKSGRIRIVKVFVYSDRERLYRCTESFSRQKGLDIYKRDYDSITQPYDGNAKIAVIRLHRNGLAGGVVLRECIRAALHIYRADKINKDDLAVDCISIDATDLGNLIADIFGRVLKVLSRRGYYKK